MSDKLVNAIADMQEDEALELARNMIKEGVDPVEILAQCRKGMEVVGQRFADGEYFIPELMMAGEILTQISDITKSEMSGSAAEVETIGKFLIGTVQGDIHDIGKNIVTFMLDVNGFDVVDIGVDVPIDKFVEAIKEHKPDVVGMSGILTLAYDPMKDTIAAIKDAGLRDDVKIVIGGGSIDEQIREYTGADAVAADAMQGVTIAKEWIGV